MSLGVKELGVKKKRKKKKRRSIRNPSMGTEHGNRI
jgi:hypothetical protein